MQLTNDIRYALRKLQIGGHNSDCPKNQDQNSECDCGYTNAMMIADEALDDEMWVVRRRL